MNVEEYVKLRCALNNKNYTEVVYDKAYKTFSFEAEKKVLDDEQKIKYAIKYFINDYGKDSKEDFQYTVNVSATFFLKRTDLNQANAKGFKLDKYDTLSMYYNFSYYQEPSFVEKIIEDTWNHINLFTPNPYLNRK